MGKELEGLEEGLKVKIHLGSLRGTLTMYQTGKRQDMMAYTDIWLKKITSTHDKLAIEWIDAYKKQTYLTDDPKYTPKELLQTTTEQ